MNTGNIGSTKISFVYALTISESLPNLSAKMLFAQFYPSEENGNASTDVLALGQQLSQVCKLGDTGNASFVYCISELSPEAWPVLESAVELGNH